MHARIFAAVLLVIGAASRAVAQAPAPEPCEDSKGLQECFERIQRAAVPPTSEQDIDKTEKTQEENVKRELATAQTGADSGGTTTAATMTDLAQWLNALGLVSSGDAEGSKIAVDLNFLLPVQGGLKNNNAQLKAVINTEPEPLDELVQAFGEDVREARKGSLQKDIAAFGDAELSFTWALVNSRFGRDYSVLRKNIAAMNQGAVDRGRSEASKSANLAFQAVLKRAVEAVRLGNLAKKVENPDSMPVPVVAAFHDLPISSDLKEELKAATLQAAVERAATTAAIQAELERSGFNRLAELVEQQPQLLFTVAHDFRDEIVGPETTRATVTWEVNGRNLSNFLRNDGKICMDSRVASSTSAEYNTCVNELQEYLGDGLQDQLRWKLEASYKRVESATYNFPDDNISLTLPKHDRWEVAFGLGRALSNDKNGGRIDFELSYDSSLDNDNTNKERVTASLTYTRRVGDMDMPFSIVYANKDEFLGEVDHQISMNVGLKFRQPKN